MKVVAFLILCVTSSSIVFGQHNVFSVGSTTALTVTGGTLFSADSLVLSPGSNFTMASKSLLETPVPSAGYPNGTIKRVYYWNSPVTFTGTLQIYYQLSELNGNTESLLNFSDSTVGSWWLVTWTGFVNTTSHYVQYPASALTFNAATAAQTGAILLLKLLSFTGNWDVNHVALTWVVDQNEESKSFTVESSIDGQQWQTVSIVPGSLVTGQYKYLSNDYDAAFTTNLYRIKITGLSSEISYSPIIKINKSSIACNMYVVGKINGATIYFSGLQPKAVRLLNSYGQLVWMSNISHPKYELANLLPGVYFVQYEMKGAMGAKQFVVQ